MTEPNPLAPPPATPPQSDSAPSNFETVIPEEFRDRPYLTDIKTLPVGPDAYKALFSKLDGAQKLIGKKAGIPDPGAPAEEWERFHAQLRPAKAEDYEIKTREGATPDEEALKAVRGMFYEAGLSKAQAGKLQAKFEEFVTAKQGAQLEEQKKLDEDFEKLTKEAFGGDNVKVLESSKVLLDQLTPDALKPHLSRLSNEGLVILAGVMQSVRSKYIKEDGNGGVPGGGAAPDLASLDEEGKTLIASDAYNNPWNKDHERVRSRVSQIYDTLGKARSGKK